jgi:hypothetical protein
MQRPTTEPRGPSSELARAQPFPNVATGELAAETLRLYEGDWARFARFGATRRQSTLPAAPDLVIAFLEQPDAGRAVLTRRLAAIDHKHRQFGFVPPGLAPEIRAALKVARKTAPRATPPEKPSPVRLEQLARSCPGDLAGRRDRALLLLAAGGWGRAALVGLRAEQLRFTEQGVTLKAGDGEAHVQVPRSPALASCAVRALEDWLRVSDRYGPVFRKVNRWGGLEGVVLGTDAVRRILARRTAELKPR